MNQHLDCYHFRPPTSIQTLQSGTSSFRSLRCYWKSGHTVVGEAKLCIDEYWEVVGWFPIGAPPVHLTKIRYHLCKQEKHTNCGTKSADMLAIILAGKF